MMSEHGNPPSASRKNIPYEKEVNRKQKRLEKREPALSIGGAAARKREQLLNKLLENKSKAFIQKGPIGKGMVGLNLNCGLGDIALLLADKVKSTGSIVGADINQINIDISKQKAAITKMDNLIFFHQGNIDDFPSKTFDFVYARFLFSNTPNPMNLVKQLVGLLKPGGWILTEDMDFSRQYCYPSSFAFTRYTELYASLAKRRQLDPTLGSKLNSILQAKGLEQIISMQVPPIFLEGPYKQIGSLTLESISKKILEEELALPAEIDALTNELISLEKSTSTMISLPGIYQVQAVKPKA